VIKFFFLSLIVLQALATNSWLQIHPKLELNTEQPFVLNKTFSATLVITEECKAIVLDLFDIDMPEHQHGMITKAKWTCTPKSKSCNITGLKLHMPGSWRVRAKLRCDNRLITAEHRFDAKL
jgi:uncharacterized protein YxjI